MKIYCVTNDPFLSQELAMQLSPSEHTIELFSDGLAALENINDNLPDLVMIDTECDNINSIVLINLVSRDSKFNNTEIHYITSKSVSDPEGFKKENQVNRIWPKPANISEIINYLSSQS